jgi:predicted HTH domain antitoxin
MSYALRIPYDDSILLASSQTREEFEKEARFLLAAKLFDLGRLSSGKAAEFCGMLRADFLISLERVGVSAIQLRPEDLEDEVAFGRRS